jgi:hypothetical protein
MHFLEPGIEELYLPVKSSMGFSALDTQREAVSLLVDITGKGGPRHQISCRHSPGSPPCTRIARSLGVPGSVRSNRPDRRGMA